MKILVTGANGYLGQGIVKELIDAGNEVIATDYQINFIDERAQRIKSNIFEIDNPFYYFGKPDSVLHLAWRDGFVHYSNVNIKECSVLDALCISKIYQNTIFLLSK